LTLFRRALFAAFYQGQDVPKRFDGICELLRRVLSTMGLQPQNATVDPAILLARMRETPSEDSGRQRGSGGL
jgi:hypothetical protein